MINKTKYKCDECSRKQKNSSMRLYKDKYLCFWCYDKKFHRMPNFNNPLRHTLKEALNKTYEMKGYLRKDNCIQCLMSFPSILVGHKVRLVLVHEENFKDCKVYKLNNQTINKENLK